MVSIGLQVRVKHEKSDHCIESQLATRVLDVERKNVLMDRGQLQKPPMNLEGCACATGYPLTSTESPHMHARQIRFRGLGYAGVWTSQSEQAHKLSRTEGA